MSLAARAARGAVFMGTSTVSNLVMGLFGGILLARLLDPDHFGTFTLATSVSALVDLRAKFQLDQMFVRDQDSRSEYLDTFFTLSLALAGLSLLLLLVPGVGALVFNRFDLAICLAVVGIVGVMDPLSTAVRLSIEKQMLFGRVALIQSLVSLAQLAATVVGAVAGLGLWSLPLGYAAGALLNLALLLQIAPRRPALRLDRPLAHEFLVYGVRYGLVYASSAVVLTQGDNLIVGLIGGTAILGFYDRAYRTALWPTLLVSAFLARISLPTYARLQDDHQRLTKAFSIVLWAILSSTTPIALVVLVSAQDIVMLLYGSKWLSTVPVLQVMAIFAILRPLWDDAISILVATKRSGQMAKLVFIQAATLVVLAIPLTSLYGAVGTAASVGLAFMISTGFLLYFAHLHLKVELLQTAGLPLVNSLSALVVYLVSRLAMPLEDLGPVLRLSLEAGLLLGLYGLASAVTSRDTIVSRVRYILAAART